jgi:murein DD-endopeptidase MepM/ murein hydrolase activator NlpD
MWIGMIALVAALLPTSDPGWQWPLRPPPKVLRGFDPPAHPWEPGHRGVDLSASPGERVYASGPGRVTFARDLAGRGVVTVDHGRLRTTYLPVRPSVRPGQVVKAGSRIGVIENILGHCGQSTCLHWGLRQGVTYLDPLMLLGRAPVRLLPWWDEAAPSPLDLTDPPVPEAPKPPYAPATPYAPAPP